MLDCVYGGYFGVCRSKRACSDTVCENSAIEFSASPPLAVQGRWSELGSLAGRPAFTAAGNCINLLAQFALACGAMWNHIVFRIDGGQPALKNGRSG